MGNFDVVTSLNRGLIASTHLSLLPNDIRQVFWMDGVDNVAEEAASRRLTNPELISEIHANIRVSTAHSN